MCGSGRTSVMKELHSLLHKQDNLYDGQVKIELDNEEDSQVNDGDEEDMLKFFLNVTPKNGLYKNAKIKFKVKVNVNSYPDEAPSVECLNKIHHPNIEVFDKRDVEMDICVSLLDEDWQPEVGLDGCVMAVLFLFYHPDIDDALSSQVIVGDWALFEENVYKSLRGETFGGCNYDRLIDIDDDEEKDAALMGASDVDGCKKNENNEELNSTGVTEEKEKECDNENGNKMFQSAADALPDILQNTSPETDSTINKSICMSSKDIQLRPVQRFWMKTKCSFSHFFELFRKGS